MNNSYQSNPPHPHVHWQVYPRYKQPQELRGTMFEDLRYGGPYDDYARKAVSDEVIQGIADKLKSVLR